MIVCYITQACTSETVDQIGIFLLIVGVAILVSMGIAWLVSR